MSAHANTLASRASSLREKGTAHATYNIQTVGSLGRAFFGGEGIFMTRLTGPGTVLLQSLKRTTASAANVSGGG